MAGLQPVLAMISHYSSSTFSTQNLPKTTFRFQSEGIENIAVTLFLVDVSWQVWRMGAMAEMFIAVWDEWGERMDTMGWLNYRNLV